MPDQHHISRALLSHYGFRALNDALSTRDLFSVIYFLLFPFLSADGGGGGTLPYPAKEEEAAATLIAQYAR